MLNKIQISKIQMNKILMNKIEMNKILMNKIQMNKIWNFIFYIVDTRFQFFRLHHSHIVRDFCVEEEIELVFNVAYRPDLQSGIERVWMLAKKMYRELVDKYKATN